MDTMPGRRSWLAVALVGALIGPAVQLQQERLWPPSLWWACLAAAVFLCALAFAPRARAGGALLLLAGVSLGSFALTGMRALHYAQGSLPAALEGRDIVVTGVVAAMPQRSEGGQRFLFEVESARLAGTPVRLSGPLLLSWYGDYQRRSPAPAVRAGERWQLTVRLRAPHGQLNPHGFDYELYLWEQGVRATGYVRAASAAQAPRALGASGRFVVERLRQSVRDAIFERVHDRARAGVVAALVVGDQRAIDRTDWDIYRATGVAHLMSISGLHVTLFAWAAAAVVGWGWRRSRWLCLAVPAQHAALVGGVMLAGAYAVFSGWGVPAQRTVWMLASIALLRLSGLHWPWPIVWLLAAAVVVSVDPWALLQPGFWLSFVAVGVLFATQRAPAGRLGALLREQAVVTVALAPLTLLLFGQLSLVGLPANLVAIPWVTGVVTPLGLAGVFVAPLWELAGWAVAALGAWLELLARVPGAVWSVAAPPLGLALAALCGGLLLSMPWPPALRLMGLPMLLPVMLWQAPRPAVGSFELLAADVGQGSAAIVRTARHSLLYDTGPRWGPSSEAGSRVLVPLLRALGERLDAVVVSHSDSDHSGGAPAVLEAHAHAHLWSSIDADHAVAALRSPRRCLAGQRWVWDGVLFEFLHPQASDYASATRPNGRSCVLRVSAGGRAALLAGDIERAQERRLVARLAAGDEADGLRADVLLVPHHGSRTSSSAVFLDRVRPRIALVQAGWRNRFGHPARAVLDRYAARGIDVVSSVHCGAARWASVQPGQVVCERERRRRYWHHELPAPQAIPPAG